MATVVSSPCLLPKVFDSSTSSATMPLFAPTGLTKACSLPSSLASIRRGSLLTPFFRRHMDFPGRFPSVVCGVPSYRIPPSCRHQLWLRLLAWPERLMPLCSFSRAMRSSRRNRIRDTFACANFSSLFLLMGSAVFRLRTRTLSVRMSIATRPARGRTCS